MTPNATEYPGKTVHCPGEPCDECECEYFDIGREAAICIDCHKEYWP